MPDICLRAPGGFSKMTASVAILSPPRSLPLRAVSPIANVERALVDCTEGDPSVLTWLPGTLRDLLDADFVGAYRPLCTDHGWSLEFVYGSGHEAASRIRALRNTLAKLGRSDRPFGCNPYVVPPMQRNRALALSGARRGGTDSKSPPCEALFEGASSESHDRLRLLVCQGTRLLAWIGAARAEPFTPREVSLLQRLSRPLERRLTLERQRQAPWLGAAVLDGLMEALGRPAFVMSSSGTVEVANGAGLALLESDPQRTIAAIRESMQLGPGRGAFSVTTIAPLGSSPLVLAVKTEGRPLVVSRVEAAQREWGLSAREARVLELVVSGESNKEISCELGCAEVTVENHLTAVFRRSGARSRTDLVGRLFTRTGC
jgi:DNA-binding CsgD family transcriptional regulator